MDYNILTFTDNKYNSLEYAKRLLEALGRRFKKSFVFDSADLTDITPSIIQKAKSAHAILLGKSVSKSAIRALCKELSLHTRVCRISDLTVVNDELSGIYFGEKGFRSNQTFGREAYDTECYSELEIERTARIAYELRDTRSVTLIDKADELATSRLWRKIVTDINEDYPYVNVIMSSMENAMRELMTNGLSDTILTAKLFGDIIISILDTISDGTKFTALLGDTTLGAYGALNTNGAEISAARYERDITYAVEFMLRNSFDMQSEADCLKSAMDKAYSAENEAFTQTVLANI